MRSLTLISVLVFFNLQAFASKARTQALGEKRTYGSYFIDDARNIFYNPALINDYKDMLSFEWGADYSNSQDTTSTPRAEGGYLAEAGSLVYGLWLGRELNTANKLRKIADTSLSGEDNKFEFFIGGDAGTKWGVRLGSSQTEDESVSTETSSSDVSLGVSMGNTEVFGTVVLVNDAEYGTAEYDGKFGASIGIKQKLRAYSIYAEFKHLNFEFTQSAAPTITSEFTLDEARVGFARTHNLNEKAKVFTDLYLEYSKVEIESSLANYVGELDELRVPITIGLEYEAKKWLTWRASVSQTIISSNDASNDITAVSTPSNGKYTDTNTTTVGTGAGINYDNFVIDLFAGRDTTDSFNSRVSLTYSY